MYRPGIAYGWTSSPEAWMTAAQMNARNGQSDDDVSFINMLLLNRNVVLRFCYRAKQQRCQRGFSLYPSRFPGVRGDKNWKTVPKWTSRVRLKAKNPLPVARSFLIRTARTTRSSEMHDSRVNARGFRPEGDDATQRATEHG